MTFLPFGISRITRGDRRDRRIDGTVLDNLVVRLRSASSVSSSRVIPPVPGTEKQNKPFQMRSSVVPEPVPTVPELVLAVLELVPGTGQGTVSIPRSFGPASPMKFN
jgi:hypothetical protein